MVAATYAPGPHPRVPVAQDTTKTVEPVSATPPYSFSDVLGRQIPIVIGTGKVDGNPVIGGSTTTKVITGYQQYPNTQAGALSAGGDGFDQSIYSWPPGSKFTTGDVSSPTVDVPVYGTQQGAQLGYLLAYDPFNLGYTLVRLEVNDTVVFDAENGIAATTKFRFYGGQQTTVDTIAASTIGANAGAWQNFAMVYLDGFAASSPPTVKAVISNAVNSGTDTSAPITGPYSDTDWGDISAAYDQTTGMLYQWSLVGTQANLYVLGVDERAELFNVPWPASVADPVSFVALPGTGCVLVSSYDTAPYKVSVVDSTGSVVASTAPSGSKTWEAIAWLLAMPAGPSVFVALGQYLTVQTSPTDDANAAIAVCNVAAGTIELIDLSITYDGWAFACRGRRQSASTSFFVVNWKYDGPGEFANNTISEITWDGASVSTRDVYTIPAGYALGVGYDPQTNYLVIPAKNGGAHSIYVVDPQSGSLITTISTPHNFDMADYYGYEVSNRFFPSYGSVFLIERTEQAVYVLNLTTFAIVKFSDWPGGVHGAYPEFGIYDQGRNSWIEAYSADDTHWSVHSSAIATPLSLPLTDMITKVMQLGGYSSGELTFEGFTGLAAYGFVIDQDTNIRTILQSIADIYTFSFSDTGDGFYFKKPGRDADFSLDDTITTADLVFGDTEAVKSEDDATISTVMRVELQYISKDQGYITRPASFAMPAINNSVRIERYSTPLVLTDLDAQTFVTEKLFDLQAKRRTHSFSLTGKPTFLPGDVIAVPSGDLTFTVQIDSVDTDRNLTSDITALDFQTHVSTTITPVTAPDITPVSQVTQYIHLDIPLINYGDDLRGVALCQYGILAGRGQANWSGGILLMGATADALTQAFAQAPHQGVVGVCIDALANPLDPFGTTDTSTVTIRRTAGSTSLLVNHTEAEVLAGANLAFVGKAGRWEGIGYKTVTDNGDGTYTLSGLAVRGYRGSEVYCPLHEAGDVFVMIDPSWVGIMSLPLADLNTTMYFEGVGVGQTPAAGVITPQTIRGYAEKPYASRNLNAEVVTDGIELTWDYRSRLASGLNPANFGEATLSFEIDILEPVTDGYSVVRTLTATTNSVLYTNADIASDFGSTPVELTFRVYMMSAIVGRGYAAQRHAVFTYTPTFDSTRLTFDSTVNTFDQE